MHLVLSLVVIGAVVVAWAHVCVHLVGARRSAGRGTGRAACAGAAAPAVRLLPEGHRPPAGLGPLSPSERFLPPRRPAACATCSCSSSTGPPDPRQAGAASQASGSSDTTTSRCVARVSAT